MNYRLTPLLIAAVCLFAFGCNRQPSVGSTPSSGLSEVVLYTSIDEPYLHSLKDRFEQQTHIPLRIVTDTEATKSATLAERLLAEKDRPQADVYWGNEPFHTINLAEQNAFDPYRPRTADDVPAKWRDAKDLYTDIGLRARMIAFSTRPEFKDLVANIRGLQDLANPALKGKVAICHPAFGTASGHVAAMYLVWGPEKFSDYMRALKANDIKLLGGNSAVADQIATGALAAGPTDTDDVNNAKADKQKLDGILPDQGDDGIGTLLIPSTIALVHNAPHGQAAKRLIDFLCDPGVEQELIESRYFAFGVRGQQNVKAMNIDYTQAAHQMKKAVETALTILQSR